MGKGLSDAEGAEAVGLAGVVPGAGVGEANAAKVGVGRRTASEDGPVRPRADDGDGLVNLCDEGDEIRAGEQFGDCEAAKGVFDLISPVGGVVVRVNDSVLNDVNLLTEKEFLVEIRISNIADNLLNYEDYIKYTQTKEARFQPPRGRKI